MLDEITLSINDLLLDPNNPRFTKDLREENDVLDKEVAGKQNELLQLYSKKSSSDDDPIDIETLYKSMSTIGFVPIDRIVVRQLENSKYIVIEGNRRVSTIKTILKDIEQKNGAFSKHSRREEIEPLIRSFKEINCMLLKTKGLKPEEIKNKTSIILGLRHHGSLLEWDPLPKAYNIYKEYMQISPQLTDGFRFLTDSITKVSSRLSIKRQAVILALKTYIAYVQLSNLYAVKDRHYSLIQAGVTNKNLAINYFNSDEKTYKLDDDSLERMNNICQFDLRDEPGSVKKIIKDPKAFTRFGNLIKKRRDTQHAVIKEFADDLIARVLDEDDLEMGLENAIDALTQFEQGVKWVNTVNDLLDRQEKDLQLDDYTGTGNDKGNKDELKKIMTPLQRIMGL